ncbi:unnamed protein product [Meloidogyne enterolobii]|uniref:Uncharacterized protein n=1 Tax=Meloidogyne enterolobii TaxID=390850 RepID=A0ACB0YGZ9_MELEN
MEVKINRKRKFGEEKLIENIEIVRPILIDYYFTKCIISNIFECNYITPLHVENANLVYEIFEPTNMWEGNQTLEIVGRAEADIFDGDNVAKITFRIVSGKMKTGQCFSEIILGREAILMWENKGFRPLEQAFKCIKCGQPEIGPQ